MAVAITAYTEEFEPAVHAFNARLERSGVSYRFPMATRDAESVPVYRRGFVALQHDGHVRGGYLIQEQEFWLNGAPARVGFLQLPLSEGIIDTAFSALGARLIAHAAKRCPLLFALGMGGSGEAIVRILKVLGWPCEPVPFFFRMVRPFRVARGLSAIRRTIATRVACDTAAWTGLASLAVGMTQRSATRPDPTLELEVVDTFDDDVNRLWDAHKHQYQLVGRRTADVLNHLYPADGTRCLKLMLRRRGEAVAWAVALDTQMCAHPYFGDLRVGTIVDAFGNASDAGAVALRISTYLADRGVDLIVSNQSSRVWDSALSQAGFRRGPSNFLFAMSPVLRRAIGTDSGLSAMHLTRGDGDGPINL